MRLDLKLKSVVLENFRLFEKLEMDFHPNVTILIGENGAGKTALVEGVAKMLMPIPKLMGDSYFTESIDTISLTYYFNENDNRIGSKRWWSSEIFVECDFDGVVNQIKWMGRYGLSVVSELLQNSNINDLRRIFRRIEEDISQKINTAIPIIAYYPCEKVDNETTNGEEKKHSEPDIFKTYENALNARAFDFKRFFEWFKWQEDLELRKQPNNQTIAKSAILSMLNDKGDEDKFTHIFVDVSSLDNYRLKLKKRDAELEVNQLSAGEKSLFALVSDIARRLAIANPQSEDPLQEGGGIVIIDEIDLHLHPRWQRKIVRKLTEIFPKVQFIITTHSPLILGSVRSENIRLLDDGQVFSVPETLGQSVGVIIKRIMGVEESLFESEIGHIFKLLAKNQVEEAKGEIAAIEEKSPADIPSLREAKAVLRRKEMPAQ
jgi:predicted ATP-binding protein involved in virulence